MKLFTAKILSYIFNPLIFFLLMPYMIVLQQTHDVGVAIRWSIFSAAFVFTGLLVVLVGKIKGKFSDFDLSKREERANFYKLLWPLMVVYVFTAIFFRGIFFSLSIIAVGIVLGFLLFEIVNTKVKASIHIGVVTAFVMTVSIVYGWTYGLLVFWMIPLLAWSRLVLKRHTPIEIFTGAVLGTMITGITTILAMILL